MKKLTALLLVISLLVCSAFSAYALDEEPPVPEDPTEEYVNTRNADASLSISSNGAATIDIYCRGNPGTTHICSDTCLEKWIGTSWTTISVNGQTHLTESVNGDTLQKTYTTTAYSGTYRVKAVFTVTRGSNETVTVYSSNVTH